MIAAPSTSQPIAPDVGPGRGRIVEDARVLGLARQQLIDQLIAADAQGLGGAVQIGAVAAFILHLGDQNGFAQQRRRASDPIALRQHADDLGMRVLGDLANRAWCGSAQASSPWARSSLPHRRALEKRRSSAASSAARPIPCPDHPAPCVYMAAPSKPNLAQIMIQKMNNNNFFCVTIAAVRLQSRATMPTDPCHRRGPTRRALPPSAPAARRLAHRDDLRRCHHAAGRRDFAGQPDSRLRRPSASTSAWCAPPPRAWPRRDGSIPAASATQRVPALRRRARALRRSHHAHLRRSGNAVVGALDDWWSCLPCLLQNGKRCDAISCGAGSAKSATASSRIPNTRPTGATPAHHRLKWPRMRWFSMPKCPMPPPRRGSSRSAGISRCWASAIRHSSSVSMMPERPAPLARPWTRKPLSPSARC